MESLPQAELAVYFRRRAEVPDQELIRLTAAARAGGSRWEDIAAACGVQTDKDIAGVVSLALYDGTYTAADLLFGATQRAIQTLTASESYFPPLRWDCPGCGQQVTDRASAGRPVHVEHGHSPGCARLAADQAADDERRRARFPGLIVHSDDPAGPLQRHWLAERITDDCPRCGWRGYFHHYIATIDGDWAAAICDNCYADLHPGITVTVKYYSARIPRLPRILETRGGEAVAAIRQRTRSDHGELGFGLHPDLGQAITWRLWWKHTPMLVDDRRGNCDEDLAEVSRAEAEQIAAELAAGSWPPDAARLPWVASAYPD